MKLFYPPNDKSFYSEIYLLLLESSFTFKKVNFLYIRTKKKELYMYEVDIILFSHFYSKI